MGFADGGNFALTWFPFFAETAHHWGIAGGTERPEPTALTYLGTRFEMDGAENATEPTIHRVWARRMIVVP